MPDCLTGLPLNFGPGCINYRVQVLCYSVIAAAAYLCGWIPFGYLAAKAKGIDIRSVGSGNIGATNALRVLGKPAGIFVLLMDVFKGYAACAWLVPVIGTGWSLPPVPRSKPKPPCWPGFAPCWATITPAG